MWPVVNAWPARLTPGVPMPDERGLPAFLAGFQDAGWLPDPADAAWTPHVSPEDLSPLHEVAPPWSPISWVCQDAAWFAPDWGTALAPECGKHTAHPEWDWLEQNCRRLLTEHEGRWVAVGGSGIVAVGDDDYVVWQRARGWGGPRPLAVMVSGARGHGSSPVFNTLPRPGAGWGMDSRRPCRRMPRGRGHGSAHLSHGHGNAGQPPARPDLAVFRP